MGKSRYERAARRRAITAARAADVALAELVCDDLHTAVQARAVAPLLVWHTSVADRLADDAVREALPPVYDRSRWLTGDERVALTEALVAAVRVLRGDRLADDAVRWLLVLVWGSLDDFDDESGDIYGPAGGLLCHLNHAVRDAMLGRDPVSGVWSLLAETVLNVATPWADHEHYDYDESDPDATATHPSDDPGDEPRLALPLAVLVRLALALAVLDLDDDRPRPVPVVPVKRDPGRPRAGPRVTTGPPVRLWANLNGSATAAA